MIRRPVHATLALMVLAGCTTGFEPEDVGVTGPVLIQTSRGAYAFTVSESNYRLTVPMQFTNRTDSPVFMPRACGWVLQQRNGAAFVQAYAPVCPSIGPARVDTIPANGTLSVDFSITACRLPNCGPRLEVTTIPGLYRFRVDLFYRAVTQGENIVGADPVALEARFSNQFELVVP